MSKQYIFGLHAVEAFLHKHPKRILRLCVLQDRQDKKMSALLQLARKENIIIEPASRPELDRMTDDANHQGVVAFTEKSHQHTEADIFSILENSSQPPLILILDNIQDPHNLGACFRSADAAGVNQIVNRTTPRT